jgi:hypothetical protein
MPNNQNWKSSTVAKILLPLYFQNLISKIKSQLLYLLYSEQKDCFSLYFHYLVIKS